MIINDNRQPSVVEEENVGGPNLQLAEPAQIPDMHTEEQNIEMEQRLQPLEASIATNDLRQSHQAPNVRGSVTDFTLRQNPSADLMQT